MRAKAKPTVEAYYAVRIGTPGKHTPYFMVRRDQDGTAVPALFVFKEDAEAECPKQGHTKVVRVRVSHGVKLETKP